MTHISVLETTMSEIFDGARFDTVGQPVNKFLLNHLVAQCNHVHDFRINLALIVVIGRRCLQTILNNKNYFFCKYVLLHREKISLHYIFSLHLE